MHKADRRASRDLLPLAAIERVAALWVDTWAVIITMIRRKAGFLGQPLCLFGRQPKGLPRPQESGQAAHHVHLDVTMDQEVPPHLIPLRVFWPVLRILSVGDIGRQ